jgi:predicted nuclease with TOPRIM domain
VSRKNEFLDLREQIERTQEDLEDLRKRLNHLSRRAETSESFHIGDYVFIIDRLTPARIKRLDDTTIFSCSQFKMGIITNILGDQYHVKVSEDEIRILVIPSRENEL